MIKVVTVVENGLIHRVGLLVEEVLAKKKSKRRKHLSVWRAAARPSGACVIRRDGKRRAVWFVHSSSSPRRARASEHRSSKPVSSS